MPAITLKTRLKAWWEGYEPPVAPARVRSGESPHYPRATQKTAFTPEVETLHMIFGKGRTLPLPLNPISDLDPPLECPFGMAALFAGAETCGPAIELATEQEIQVTALEPNRDHVAVGEELSKSSNFGGTFRIGPVDLANVELSQNRYHLVISRLLLHQVPDRELLYRKFERALRRAGSLLLTQFVIANDADPDRVKAAMRSSVEPEAPTILTSDEEKELLVESGLRPQVIEDLTDQTTEHVKQLFSNWQQLVEEIARYEHQPRMLQTLLGQVEHWQPRIDLMQSGDLQVVRFRSEKRRSELF